MCKFSMHSRLSIEIEKSMLNFKKKWNIHSSTQQPKGGSKPSIHQDHSRLEFKAFSPVWARGVRAGEWERKAGRISKEVPEGQSESVTGDPRESQTLLTVGNDVLLETWWWSELILMMRAALVLGTQQQAPKRHLLNKLHKAINELSDWMSK